MKAQKFVIGVDPYQRSHGDMEGNGQWHTTAENLEDALQVIFGSMDFPCEASGRKFFQPGVSLPHAPADEVIQVWSTQPEVVKATNDFVGEGRQSGGLHDGNGHDYGLHCEVLVTDLDKFLHPARKLLKGPDTPASDNVSPMGASVIRYHEMRGEIQHAVQVQKLEVAKRQWEVQAISNEMKGKVRAMEEQVAVFNAYLHGTRHVRRLTRGAKGTGRYHVFQNRQFLSEEVALLANFQDFDFKDLERLEQWLVSSGQIWKMLPHERCILATRIRKTEKDYGDPLANIWNNMANMQNIIWIRDGENVCHVDVEYNFNNAVFPYKDQFDRAERVVLEYLFDEVFKAKEPRAWHGGKLKPGEYDEPGKMRRNPLNEENPYCTVHETKARFKTIEEWLASDALTEDLKRQINEALSAYLREENKRQMMFAVIVQGIVDNTNLLEIPKGTDMFDWQNVDKYLHLLFDYSHGLPFQGWAEKVDPYVNQCAKGDWIVVFPLSEYLSPKLRYSDGTTYKEKYPMLFRVVDMVNVEQRYHDKKEDEWKTRTVVKPVVHYHPKATRYQRSLSWEENQNRRTKAPIRLTLATSDFLRVPMSPQYAQDILNDREWKKNHQWAVTLLVNYDKIIQAMKSPRNNMAIPFKEGEDD